MFETSEYIIFAAGTVFTGGAWLVKSIFSNHTDNKTVGQKLEDHLEICDERYHRIDGRLENLDEKLDEVTSKTYETSGKLDIILTEVRKNGHLSSKE